MWDWAKNWGRMLPLVHDEAVGVAWSWRRWRWGGEHDAVRLGHEPVDATVTSVVWSSSDEAVATVSADGVVRQGCGDATITVVDLT